MSEEDTAEQTVAETAVAVSHGDYDGNAVVVANGDTDGGRICLVCAFI